MEKIVDARGLQCPMPVIETKKALQEMKKAVSLSSGSGNGLFIKTVSAETYSNHA